MKNALINRSNDHLHWLDSADLVHYYFQGTYQINYQVYQLLKTATTTQVKVVLDPQQSTVSNSVLQVVSHPKMSSFLTKGRHHRLPLVSHILLLDF